MLRSSLEINDLRDTALVDVIGSIRRNLAMPPKIAIIGGTGPEGSGLANRLARAGEHIVIGSRDAARAQQTAHELGAKIGGSAQIDGTDNASAVAQCDVTVLTIPFSGQAALLKQLKNSWKPGTVVIDTTVPLAASVGGSSTHMLGIWQGSAAEAARELLPSGVSIAAAFHNLGAELLSGDGSIDCDVLVCSDDEKAKQVAMELAGKIPGVRALNGGKLENARIVESITALLIGLNIRYKVHSAGLRFTGLPVR
jgi:8-hydroxy-5-deazaflavin:NADPH oxidoreductase